MMKKKTFAAILVLLFVLMGRPCYAPTDWVVNVIDAVNNVTQKGNEAIKKVDDATNEYTQKKIGSLGDINKLKKAKDKAASLKARYEKAQEKYKKMQALAAKAKEKKEAIANRVAIAKEHADKVKQRYEEAQAKIEAARQKIKEAQAKAEELKDKVDEAKDVIEDAKNQYAEIKDGAESVKDLASDKISAATGKISDLKSKVSGTASGTTEQTPVTEMPQMTPLQTQEQTLSTIQELTAVAPATMEISLPQEALAADLQADVTAANVNDIAQEPISETEQTQQIHTQIGLTQQLKQADSIRAVNIQNLNSGVQKLKLQDVGQNQVPMARRRTFEKASTVAKEIKDE